MEEWKERLLEEHRQLKEKYMKLVEFMNSEKYFTFDDNTKAVFVKQRAGMELYLNALNIRVFGDTKNYNNNSDLMGLFYMTMFNTFSTNTFTPSKSPEMEKLEKLMNEIPVKDENNG